MKLLTDGREFLRLEIKKRSDEIFNLKQVVHRLEGELGSLKKRYEIIDREWALRDGRYRRIEEKRQKVEKQLSLSEIVGILESLGEIEAIQMIKKFK